MLNLAQKKEVVSALHDKFTEAKIVIIVDCKGLNVPKIVGLRRRLSQAGVEFKVVKNTLLIRAAKDTAVAMVDEYFIGPSAVAMSYDDPVTPAKILSDFAKENDKLGIKAGVMPPGRVLDIDSIKSLAALPSREVLLSQVLSTMNGVPTALVRALSNVPERLLYALTAIRDQKEAA
ncbi:MAG: 50S ribosomal protein L10 [Deltaproteobacteria bacterium]|nr:50S ribosomal protein L10 [Deltaproteobacteria bacterium]